MKKIRTLIVDDERLAREEIARMLADYPELEIVDNVGSVKEAVEFIQANEPDAIFLDINLDKGTGFDVMNQVGGEHHVVFVSSHEEFRDEATKSDLSQFVLKPMNHTDTDNAIHTLIKQLKEENEVKN